MLLGGEYDENLLGTSKFPYTFTVGELSVRVVKGKDEDGGSLTYRDKISYVLLSIVPALKMESANAAHFEDDLPWTWSSSIRPSCRSLRAVPPS